MQKGKEMEFV